MAGAEPRAASSNEPRFAPQSRDLRTNGGVRTSAQVVDDERQLLLAQALLWLLWLLWLLSSAPAPSDPGPTYTQSPM